LVKNLPIPQQKVYVDESLPPTRKKRGGKSAWGWPQGVVKCKMRRLVQGAKGMEKPFEKKQPNPNELETGNATRERRGGGLTRHKTTHDGKGRKKYQNLNTNFSM